MLREAGATEVHVRISSPPVKWPCFYGIDFATRAELIANGLDVEEIAASVGADSLGYISLEGLVAATELPADNLCRACFDGVYPVELPDPELLGKHLLEVDAPSPLGHDALTRP
jgi:amidophosphoribosyltransferase